MPSRLEVTAGRERKVLRYGFAVLMLTASATTSAQEGIPPALRDWESWALHGHEMHHCPWLAPGRAVDDARICAWPAALELQIDGRGGRFSQRWQIEAEAWLPLPGGMEQWPQEVTLDGKPAAVVAHNRIPVLRVSAGTHTVSGSFTWARRPELLPLPADVGLVALTIDGARIAIPQRNATGVVLGAQPVARQDNRLDVRVFRLLSDELPGTLTTQVHLAVAGEAREVRLPSSLPEGFIPAALEGDLPARLDADNTLRVQVRPGEYDITVTARGPSPLTEVRLGAHPAAPWPAEEVWSFRGNDRLRVVAVEGVPPTDPAQANVPSDWRGLPAYRMSAGAVLRLLERSRGMSAQDANQLQLERTAWLDFSGAGFTVIDHIGGEMRQGWRLEMSPPFALESVRTVSDESLLVTSGMAPGATGVEVRQPHLDLTTVARVPRAGGALPATGWRQRFTNASGQLVVGPGYRLLAALGPDLAPQAWLERWRLLDIFAVLLIATAAGRLLGLRAAAIAVTAVVLTYQDLGAPAWLWLNVLVALALVRVVPDGRLGRLVSAYRVLALALLLIALVPFLIGQARLAVYPQLETFLSGEQGATVRSYAAMVRNAPLAGRLAAPPIQTEIVQEARKEVLPPSPAASPMASRVSPAAARLVEVTVTGSRREYSAGYEPGVLVQAGPGVPQWRYHVYDYSWSGPLEPNATARFVVSPPWLTRLWRIAGIILSVLLIVELTRGDLARLPPWLRRPRLAPAAALLLAAAAALGAAPQARADTTPAPALLDQLTSRLLEPPKCAPDCADVIEAHVSVEAARIQVTLTVTALDAVGVALPGAEPNWVPDTVQVDGATVGWVYRSASGLRYVHIPPGRHAVRIAGSLEGLEGLALAFPLAPHVIDVSAAGWDVSGVNARRLVSGALGLVRRRASQESGGAARQEEFPPFVRITRIFRLAHDWTIDTVVERVAPPSSAFTVRLRLLPQESVTSAGLEAREGHVTVGLAANVEQTEFASIIPISDALELVAPESGPYAERWVFAVGSTWHLGLSGVPPVAPGDGADGTYEYYPRPGEHLAVRITRPEPVAGGTLAYDRAELMLNAGKRSSDSSLVLSYRSTQGGRQLLHLPDEAEVTLVRSDDDTLGLRPEQGELSLPALPGRHTWTVNWRSAAGAAVVTRSPAVALSAPASNLHIGMRIPEDRWVLYAFGSGIGPAVLYWGELLVFIAVAWLIGRSRLTPLPAKDWLLLGLGLSTFSWSVFGLFVLFVALFQWRARSGPPADARRFNLLQVGLAVLAVAAVLCVVAAVPGGLLARPDMRISGAGDYGTLEWFVDQTRDGLPRPGVLSVSLWWYKVAMLAWALWLSFVLTRWLKWAWEVFARDGLWRSRPVMAPPSTRPPPAVS